MKRDQGDDSELREARYLERLASGKAYRIPLRPRGEGDAISGPVRKVP